MKAFIALVGYSRSGKDTGMEIIRNFAEKDGKSTECLRMAAHLKTVTATVFNLTEDEVCGNGYDREQRVVNPFIINRTTLTEVYNLFFSGINIDQNTNCSAFEDAEIGTVRKLLQFIGTDFLHKIGSKEVHVKVACKRCKWDSNIVISPDIRFTKELLFCSKIAASKGYKVYPIHVNSPEVSDLVEVMIASDGLHESESSITETIDICGYRVINKMGLKGYFDYMSDLLTIYETISKEKLTI